MLAAAVAVAAAFTSVGTGCTHDPREDTTFVCNALCDCAAPLGDPNASCDAQCVQFVGPVDEECLACVEKSAVCSQTINCLRTCLGGP